MSLKSLLIRAPSLAFRSRKLSTQATPTHRKLSIYRSQSHDPIFNLAAEEWLFNDVLNVSEPLPHHILYLWCNEPTVVIGKHQNPWKECRIAEMEKDGVHLVRRYSGGGAVYQDLGNMIFSFMSPKFDFSIERNMKIVCGSLQQYGIDARFSGRNDITVEGRKISGSAFKHTRDKSLHHGTLLYDVDLDALQRYLTPSRLKLQSKGVSSVSSRVANIREIHDFLPSEIINTALEDLFCSAFSLPRFLAKTSDITPESLASTPSFQKRYESLADWNWRFGQTPSFDHQLEYKFSWALFEVNIKSDKGQILAVKLYSDALNPSLVEELERQLNSAGSYSASSIEAACRKAKEAFPDDEVARGQIDEFSQWLAKAL